MTNNGKKSKDQSTAGIALLRPRKVTITGCYSAANQYGAYILGERTGDPSTVKGDVVFNGNTRLTGNRREGLLVQNAITQPRARPLEDLEQLQEEEVRVRRHADQAGRERQVTDSAITTKHRYGVYTDKGVTGVVLTRPTSPGTRRAPTRGPGITVVSV